MPKDRDQLTPEDPDDAEALASGRHQGTGGTGLDELPSEGSPDPAESESDIPDAEV